MRPDAPKFDPALPALLELIFCPLDELRPLGNVLMTLIYTGIGFPRFLESMYDDPERKDDAGEESFCWALPSPPPPSYFEAKSVV